MSKEEKDRKVQGLNGLQEDDLSTACFIRHLLDSRFPPFCTGMHND
jgi:hypothetical protein